MNVFLVPAHPGSPEQRAIKLLFDKLVQQIDVHLKEKIGTRDEGMLLILSVSVYA